MDTIELMISGKVQNVGFRYHVYQIAQQLHLKGTVRNLTDGKVCILVQCDESVIQNFIQQLYRYPHRFMKIDTLAQSHISVPTTYNDFSIVY